MNYIQALEYIESLKVFGSKPGLERIEYLLNKLSNPQNNLKFIHVAGTNGKGSVCNYISEICISAGLKTGLYISPFVIDFRERIQINRQYIDQQLLADLTKKCKNIIEEYENPALQPTEFEFITAVAFLYFSIQNCDVVILETGLGGRFDATNIIKFPVLSVITPVDLDHTHVLGETIEKIAFEKSGIIKKNSRVITTSAQPKEVLEIIKKEAKNARSEFYVAELDKIKDLSVSLSSTKFSFEKEKYKTLLIGSFQAQNAALAIEAAKVCGLRITSKNIKEGLLNTKLPARFEIVSKNPLIILDGAHNPNGVDALMKNLQLVNRHNLIAIIGMMADKNVNKAMQISLKNFKTVITVKVPFNERAMSAGALKEIADKYCSDVIAAQSLDNALQIAIDKSDKNTAIIIFGSLYLAGNIREKL